MRLYNPAIGKFLNVDPIGAQYPMLTPYQFSNNRPIDGVDLDGFEYLSAKSAKIEFTYGGVQIKLTNLHNVSSNQIQSLNNDTKNWYDRKTGEPTIGVDLRVAYINFIQDDPKTDKEAFKKIPTINRSNRPPDGNNFNVKNDPTIVPGAPQKNFAKGTLLVGAVITGLQKLKGYLVSDDLNTIKNQNERIASMVIEDINYALLQGERIIPKKYQNQGDLAKISNVILQGESNSDNKELYDIGMKIYNTISSQRNPKFNPSGLDNVPTITRPLITEPPQSKEAGKQK
jgi:hypothetical protein